MEVELVKMEQILHLVLFYFSVPTAWHQVNIIELL